MKDQELSVHLLGMQKEDCYAVVALGMDIWGYGETPLSATVNLQDHIHMQLTYLIRSNKVELIHRKAPVEYYDMYNECVIARIKNEVVPGWWISTLSIPLEEEDNNLSEAGNAKTIRSSSTRYASAVCHRIAA